MLLSKVHRRGKAQARTSRGIGYREKSKNIGILDIWTATHLEKNVSAIYVGSWVASKSPFVRYVEQPRV